jgi:glutaminase
MGPSVIFLRTETALPIESSVALAKKVSNILAEVAAEMDEKIDRGKVADYIPELAAVNNRQFGIAVALRDGSIHTSGNAMSSFSIQSISKIFTLCLALGKLGDTIWYRVGREPSGSAFNSIVQLEFEKGRPRNPLINAGAIVIADLVLAGHEPSETIGEILRFIRAAAGDESIFVDEAVARSESQTGFRNFALANYMKSFGILSNTVERTLGVYFHHCAVAMNCVQLAKAGRFLAFGGRNPETGFTVVSQERARRIGALMLTCGQYDGSGDFAFRVGLPSKSGVGGGILALAPGKASIAVWSPGLDQQGNSLLGTVALEKLASSMSWSVFNG